MKSIARASNAATVLAVVLLALLAASPASAQTAVTFTGSSVGDINIRSSPGVNASPIGVLPAGEKVIAIGRNAGNNWIQVQFGATTGWVAAWLTVYSGDTVLLPVISDDNPPPPAADKDGPFIVTSPYNVNVRAGPDIKANVLTIMPFTGQATAVTRTDASNWLKIQYKSTTGWVAKWRVILSTDVNILPVDGSAPSAPGATSQPVPTSPFSTPSVPASTPSALPTSLPEGSIVVVAPSRANIRSAPQVTASILDIISFADLVVAVGQNAGHNWLQVTHNGTTGWVARWVVLSSDDTTLLPVTSSNSDTVPAPGGAVSGKGIYDVFVRSGPSINNGQVAVLPAYTSVLLVARTDASNWVKVDFQGTQGWVAAWVIVATADINNLPIQSP